MNGANPSWFQGANAGNVNTDNRPVDSVSWDTITQAFLPALNTATGKTFRLPSEAEWEYACRADTTTAFYWGGDDSDYADIGNYAWYATNSGSETNDVGLKLPNAWDLCDMSGNVWEWVQDGYHSTYTGAPTDGSAWESPTTDSYRVIRGGAWNNYNYNFRSANRYYFDPSTPNPAFGFRLAR